MKSRKAMKGVASAALAVALVAAFSPAAFAATTPTVDSGNTTVNTNGGEANTNVKVLGGDNQLKVTVPVGFSVAATTAGGNFQKAPTTYAIKNGSLFPVQITSVAVAPQEGWEYSASDLRTTDTPQDANNTGVINLKLTPEGGTVAVLDADAAIDTSAETGWTIAGKTTNTDVSKKIKIEGSTSKLTKLIDDAAAPAAATITYTIAPADAAPAAE